MSRILIVEDDAGQRDVLSRYLRFIGAEVESAMTGPMGVSLADRFHPEMVLLDIGLPEMNGWEVLDAMRKMRAMSNAHYVAITGQALTKEEVRAAHFCGYLAKPIAPFAVMRQIEGCLGTFHHPD